MESPGACVTDQVSRGHFFGCPSVVLDLSPVLR